MKREEAVELFTYVKNMERMISEKLKVVTDEVQAAKIVDATSVPAQEWLIIANDLLSAARSLEHADSHLDSVIKMISS